MTRYIVIWMMSMALISCGNSEGRSIEILEDESKLIDLIVDMHIAEATINRQNILYRDSLRIHYRDNILLIHDISELDYDTVFWIIQQDVAKYRGIQEEVYQKLKIIKDNS